MVGQFFPLCWLHITMTGAETSPSMAEISHLSQFSSGHTEAKHLGSWVFQGYSACILKAVPLFRMLDP